MTTEFLLVGGCYVLCAALFDWDFFFESRIDPFVVLFGRGVARIVYALMGAYLLFVAFRNLN